MLMPSSATLRSQPPKTGIQYPNRIALCRPLDLLVKQPAAERRDRTERRPRGHGLDLGVVVRVRVDVVCHEPTVGGLDELKTGHLDTVPASEIQVLADDRMVKTLPETEKG